MALRIPVGAWECAGCGAPTSVNTMAPVRVTTMSFLRLVAVVTIHTRPAKKTAYHVICIAFSYRSTALERALLSTIEAGSYCEVHSARNLLRKGVDLRETLRKFGRQLLISLQQWLACLFL